MYRNTLCTDPDCKQDCAHRGPTGQYCYFEVEKKLCQLLGKTWLPAITVEECIADLERLLERDSNLTSRLAERMQPLKVVNDDPAS